MVTYYIKVGDDKFKLPENIVLELESFKKHGNVTTIDDTLREKYKLNNCPLRFSRCKMNMFCASLTSLEPDEYYRPCNNLRHNHVVNALLFREGNYKWEWLNDKTWTKIEGVDLEFIEMEYQKHKKHIRYKNKPYYCFNNNQAAIINFTKMETRCPSRGCLYKHEILGIPHNHLRYKLRRLNTVLD